MKVFKISSDVDNYQWISPSDESLYKQGVLDFYGDKKENWEPFKCFVFDLKKMRGNFFRLTTTSLTFDKKAYECMGDILEMAGDILPIHLESGEELFVLNVTECINAVDQEKSEWNMNGDKRGSIKSMAFHADRMSESSLFKVPEINYGSVLGYEGLKDPHDEFIARYRENGLSGLIFKELWSA